MRNKILKFLGAVIFCELAGVVGSLFTAPAVAGWYQTAKRPSFTPPDWIFGPVWALIFFLMGAGLYILIEKKGIFRKKALVVFGIQLFLNIAWSFFFFYLRNPLLAFIDIVVLWVSILLLILFSAKVDKKLLWLFLPYLLWVSFAGALNFAFLYA